MRITMGSKVYDRPTKAILPPESFGERFAIAGRVVWFYFRGTGPNSPVSPRWEEGGDNGWAGTGTYFTGFE
jgi:hypothetical protein